MDQPRLTWPVGVRLTHWLPRNAGPPLDERGSSHALDEAGGAICGVWARGGAGTAGRLTLDLRWGWIVRRDTEYIPSMSSRGVKSGPFGRVRMEDGEDEGNFSAIVPLRPRWGWTADASCEYFWPWIIRCSRTCCAARDIAIDPPAKRRAHAPSAKRRRGSHPDAPPLHPSRDFNRVATPVDSCLPAKGRKVSQACSNADHVVQKGLYSSPRVSPIMSCFIQRALAPESDSGGHVQSPDCRQRTRALAASEDWVRARRRWPGTC